MTRRLGTTLAAAALVALACGPLAGCEKRDSYVLKPAESHDGHDHKPGESHDDHDHK